MYQALWHALRPFVAETEYADRRAAARPAVPQIVADYDQAYVEAHPELYAPDTHKFHYDRDPLPSEWDENLPSDCYVRVFVINAWTTVRVLHAPNGTRLQEPVMDSWGDISPTYSEFPMVCS